MAEIVVHRGVRYTRADAQRLGIPTDGKVVTRKSKVVESRAVDVDPLTTVSAGIAPEPVQEPGQDEGTAPVPAPEPVQAPNPGKSGKKDDWIEFALANGKTAEDLEGLTRDQIAELFA